jgi:hypothetical protein
VKILALTAICALAAMPAFARQPAAARTRPPAFEARPATTTVTGDTGLWFVPAGEVLPARRWSLSAYRANSDYDQGFTDVSNWPVTFGVGVNGRAEIFAALTIMNRIDRDVRPLFFRDIAAGAVVNDYPLVTTGWTGTNLGDLWFGTKFNLTSQHRQSAAALALRAILKVPTADRDTGAGTGKADVTFDAIVSREMNERIELSGFGGFIVRGDPQALDLLNGFRWGFGVGLPTRRHLRLTAEVQGEAYAGNTITVNGTAIQATDGSGVPARSAQKNLASAAIGLTWLGSNGLFAGGGLSWNLRMKGRGEFGAFEDETGDAIGLQVRVGYRVKRN